MTVLSNVQGEENGTALMAKNNVFVPKLRFEAASEAELRDRRFPGRG